MKKKINAIEGSVGENLKQLMLSEFFLNIMKKGFTLLIFALVTIVTCGIWKNVPATNLITVCIGLALFPLAIIIPGTAQMLIAMNSSVGSAIEIDGQKVFQKHAGPSEKTKEINDPVVIYFKGSYLSIVSKRNPMVRFLIFGSTDYLQTTFEIFKNEGFESRIQDGNFRLFGK